MCSVFIGKFLETIDRILKKRISERAFSILHFRTFPITFQRFPRIYGCTNAVFISKPQII